MGKNTEITGLVLVGHVGVDSGQLMIVDPCYLDRWVNNDFNFKAGIRNKQTGKIICCWDELENVGKINWATPLPEYNGKCMNDLAEDKDTWEKFTDYPDKGGFNYSGVSAVTCDDNFGEIESGTAVVSSTNFGDGVYPVYAEVKGGRVKRLIVDFEDEGEDEDEDEE